MSGPLNIQIVKTIMGKTDDDLILQRFIKELLFDELEHPSQWWFKDHYKKKIRQYSKKWNQENEN